METVNGLDTLRIDGEDYTVDNVYNLGFRANIVHVSTLDGPEFYLAEDSEEAGRAARERWEDMRNNDKAEFKCIIGTERLLQWACGESDSFGISSFDEFLDVTESVPNEEFGSYDGTEIDDVSVSDDLAEQIGFRPTVAYRHN